MKTNKIINTVLIDDEFHSTEVLEDMILKNCPELQILEKFNNSQLALDFLLNNTVDLIFLDIEMPFLNGFELVNLLMEKKCLPAVVFVTAYDQYAIKAFKFAAFDYILKPVELTDLKVVIDNYSNKKLQLSDERWDYLIELYKQQNNFDKIVLSVQDGFEIVKISDIIHIDSDSNYSTVFIENQKPIVISRTLKDFEQTLKDKGFLRIHNSHLVNLSKIIKFIKADGGYAVMTNNTKLSVSKSKKEDLINFFQNLL